MFIALFFIVLLARVPSYDCVWEKVEPKMSVVEQLFRDIFFDPFGNYLYSEPLPEVKCESTGTSFVKHWVDALYQSLPSCDCFESSRTIGEEMFHAIFLALFGFDLEPHKEKPPEEISFWNYWDDPVFIFLDVLLAICLAIIVYTCIQSLKSQVPKEKNKKDVGVQVKLTADKSTQTEDDSGPSRNSGAVGVWWNSVFITGRGKNKPNIKHGIDMENVEPIG